MKKALTLILTLLAVAPTVVHAQTVLYVSDTLEAPLRTGASTRYRIVSMLKSGTPVEVLKVDSASGYTRVRAGSVQGWILSRYLMDTPAARQVLEPLESENASLKTQLETITAKQSDMEGHYGQLHDENQRLSQELAQLRKTAANAVAIDGQNQLLQEQVVNLERELQIAQQENQSLADTSNQTWFLLGALVLLGGTILGLLFPRLRFQRRNRWDEL